MRALSADKSLDGDLIPGTAWVHVPVTMGYDRFAELVIDETLDLYGKAEPEKWLLLSTHDTKCAASAIARDDSGKYHAAEEHPRLERFAV